MMEIKRKTLALWIIAPLLYRILGIAGIAFLLQVTANYVITRGYCTPKPYPYSLPFSPL